MDQTDRSDDRRAADSRLSSDSESAVKGITKRRNPESQNARKPRPAPGFLAKSNTCSTQITPTHQSLPNSSRTTKKSFEVAPGRLRFCAHRLAALMPPRTRSGDR